MSRDNPPPTDVAGLAQEMASHCLAFRSRLLSRRVSRLYDEELRPFRLTVSQLNVLLGAGAFGPARASEIATGLGMDKSTLSRSLRRLERRALIASSQPASGGGRMLRLTPRGGELLREVAPAWSRAQERARGLLGPEGADSLTGLGEPFSPPKPTTHPA